MLRNLLEVLANARDDNIPSSLCAENRLLNFKEFILAVRELQKHPAEEGEMSDGS